MNNSENQAHPRCAVIILNWNGADLLRLWAASADYHADVRCSHEIFKQLSQN